MTHSQPVQTSWSPEELKALDRVTEELCHQFPTLPSQAIVEQVQRALRQFAEAPIREFVAVFVERQVRTLLTGTPAADAPGPDADPRLSPDA